MKGEDYCGVAAVRLRGIASPQRRLSKVRRRWIAFADGETSALHIVASSHGERLPCKGETTSLLPRRGCLQASEKVELPRSEGPKGEAATILGQEFDRRDPSSRRHRGRRNNQLALVLRVYSRLNAATTSRLQEQLEIVTKEDSSDPGGEATLGRLRGAGGFSPSVSLIT